MKKNNNKKEKRKERNWRKKKQMRVLKFRGNGIKFEQCSIGVTMMMMMRMMMNVIRVSRSSSWPGEVY